MKSIAVYCGSSNKVSKKYRDEAIRVGEYLAKNNFKIVGKKLRMFKNFYILQKHI